ncbi:MAG: Glu-tRNA(Gln) amidotransferase subunit GatE, partial [Candidatus Diapherotrites archaeon]|nr:Glu-tRNA(Gln) amidotransferase subunit GatE [Candidatus Diapherotrites archaeon]
VIDGSNTSAFQRTALIALGGEFEIENPGEDEKNTKIKNAKEKSKKKKISVQIILLEEDAARPIRKEQGKIYYNLDRLGIPLIEVATGPDIRTPKEAVIVAAKIGEIMRLTCNAKRGKGTIRQDINVSIAKGARCEIKGCQELELVGTIIEKEVERQIDLLQLNKKLNAKFGGKTEERKNIFSDVKELTEALQNSECKFVKGKSTFGMKIKKGKGILGEKVGAKRFGSELSNYAKATGVSGLIHRDELPNYGISEKDVDDICKELGCKAEDGFVIIVAEKEKALKAFDAVKERFLVTFERIPSETRGALEDGNSEYQRALSSEARMYPETDLPFEIISEKMLVEINKELPLSVTEREKLYSSMGLSTNHIEEMKLSNYARFFERIVAKGANPKTSATLLLQTLTELKREGIEIEKVKLDEIEELLLAESKGKINRTALSDAMKEFTKRATIGEILSGNKTSQIDNKTIEKIIITLVSKNMTLVKTKGMGAIGPLMGDLMKEPALKGIDGKVLSEILKKEIIANK